MKKIIMIFLLIGIFVGCYFVKAQNSVNFDKTTVVKSQPQPIMRIVKINLKQDTIVAIDTVKTLVIESVKKDSVIQTQADTIRAKNNEIIQFKDYFKNELWSGQNPYIFYVAFIFAFIGILFMWLCKTYFGASTDEYKWKKAFSSKNIVRGFIGFILATLTIYLTLYLFPIVGQISVVTNTYALIIGAGWQVFAKKLMKFFETKTPVKTEPEPEIKEFKI